MGPISIWTNAGQFRQHLTQLNKTDQTRQWETTLVSRQKEHIPVSLTAAATQGPDGTLTSLRWLLHDTTEQVRAKNKLQESESKWRSLTETSPDHILTLDRDLNIEFANFASPGLTVEDLMGTPLYAYLEEARQAEVKAILEKVLRTGQDASYETTYLNPDGGTIYYETSVTPRSLPGSNKIVGLTVASRDITARKQTDLKIQTSEEKLRSALESAVADSWEMDLRTGTLTFGDRWAQHLGYQPGEVPQTIDGIDAITHPEDVLKNSERYKAYLRGEADILETECRIRKKDGDWAWIMTRGKVVEWENGAPVRLTGTNVDITERVLAEQEKTHSYQLVLAISQAAEAVQRARSPQAVYKAIGEQVRRLGLDATIYTLNEDRTHLIVSYHLYPIRTWCKSSRN